MTGPVSFRVGESLPAPEVRDTAKFISPRNPRRKKRGRHPSSRAFEAALQKPHNAQPRDTTSSATYRRQVKAAKAKWARNSTGGSPPA